MEAPLASSLMAEPRGVGRDAQTDARTISEASGQMSDELDMSGWQVDADSDNIGDEIRQGGWMKYTEPVGGTPARVNTSGFSGGRRYREDLMAKKKPIKIKPSKVGSFTAAAKSGESTRPMRPVSSMTPMPRPRCVRKRTSLAMLPNGTTKWLGSSSITSLVRWEPTSPTLAPPSPLL